MELHRLVILVALAAAIAVPAAAETPVCTDPADQRNAVVSGSVVAWEDSRNGHLDIYLKNLETGAETRVTASLADDTNPDLDGDRIVYRSGTDEIRLHEIGTGATSTIASGPGERSHPRISGNWIVWQDHRGSDWDVYLFDIATGTGRPLTGPGDQHSPSVEGNQLAWVSVDASSGESSVVAYDTVTSSYFLIASAGHPTAPDLGGGAVTYLARDAGGQRVYSRALTGGQPRALPVGPGEHLSQRIDGARVVLEASGSGIWLYSMNFDTATLVTVNGDGTGDRNPAIDGTRVVWETNRSGTWDIYTWTTDTGSVSPAPTVVTVPPASRFGPRRYVVGAVPLSPPTGIAGDAGRTIGAAPRPRTIIGTGTTTGVSPPASRFVRWSPVTWWRSGAR